MLRRHSRDDRRSPRKGAPAVERCQGAAGRPAEHVPPGLAGAFGKGALPAATRERIALAVAQVNDCGYCLSAHSYRGLKPAKISPEEVAPDRKGESSHAKVNAAVRFATEVVRERGHITDADIKASAMPVSATAGSSRSPRPTSKFRSSAQAAPPDSSAGRRLFSVVGPPVARAQEYRHAIRIP
jgi:AhpD family alkylhydroperoxidase